MAALCFVLSLVITFVCAQNKRITSASYLTSGRSCTHCKSQIPVDVALQLSTLSDEQQLFQHFLQLPRLEAASVLKGVQLRASTSQSVSVHGIEGVETTVGDSSKPVPAKCIPELTVVSLTPTGADPLSVYWPSCTRIERCGGCCSHQQLSCQPTEFQIVNFQVVKADYVNNQLQYKGKEIVPIEKHSKCKCDCIIKEADCSHLQEYVKSQCRCVCKNKDAEAQCMAMDGKEWNYNSCSCQCIEVFECSAGTIFSFATCSCVPIPTALNTRNRYSYRQSLPPPPRYRSSHHNGGQVVY